MTIKPITGERTPRSQLTQVAGLLSDIARQSASAPGRCYDEMQQITRLHALAPRPRPKPLTC